LGRYNDLGELEFVGRIDEQLKVRGYRIELGEVEYQLKKIAGVENGLVTTVSGLDGLELLAYYIGQVEESQLRKGLSAVLPEFMLPAHYVQLQQFPLTTNGKIDRTALPRLNESPIAKSKRPLDTPN
ncbi:hypothetical protein, partial [Salmonella enterica]|uniref:hypothetical protein n=1 Tax=Salmonella enterica TaxID=28901 RepID=UPI00352322D6